MWVPILPVIASTQVKPWATSRDSTTTAVSMCVSSTRTRTLQLTSRSWWQMSSTTSTTQEKLIARTLLPTISSSSIPISPTNKYTSRSSATSPESRSRPLKTKKISTINSSMSSKRKKSSEFCSYLYPGTILAATAVKSSALAANCPTMKSFLANMSSLIRRTSTRKRKKLILSCIGGRMRRKSRRFSIKLKKKTKPHSPREALNVLLQAHRQMSPSMIASSSLKKKKLWLKTTLGIAQNARTLYLPRRKWRFTRLQRYSFFASRDSSAKTTSPKR